MTDSETAAAGVGIFLYLIIVLAVAVLVVIGWWKIFTKAGQPGWAAIIPLYNIYILLKVVGRPGWWLILYFIPLIDFVIQIIVNLDLAKSFGKSAGYAIGLIFLPFVFYPMLGLGSSRYVGPAAV
jgi:hypothetical protein